jgi:hypothetical protein
MPLSSRDTARLQCAAHHCRIDRWQDLSSALESIRAKEGCCFRAVLHARKDLPENPRLREAVNEIARA